MDIDRNNSSVARNYAFILVGLIVFPLVFFAHFMARKRRGRVGGIEQSHYEFQYRTTSIALLGLTAITLVFIAIILGTPSQTAVQHAQQKMLFITLNNIGWLAMLWVAVRCIRGLYLSAASRAIQNPKTLWVWPAA